MRVQLKSALVGERIEAQGGVSVFLDHWHASSPNIGSTTVAVGGEIKKFSFIRRAFNSHGCLGLSREIASYLFARLDVNDNVNVYESKESMRAELAAFSL
jgi:hypothetical protein